MDRRVKRRVENPCEVFQVSLKWRMFPRFCSVRCVNSSFFLFFQFFFFFLLYIQLVDSSSFFSVLHLRYGLKLLFFGIPYVLKKGRVSRPPRVDLTINNRSNSENYSRPLGDLRGNGQRNDEFFFFSIVSLMRPSDERFPLDDR